MSFLENTRRPAGLGVKREKGRITMVREISKAQKQIRVGAHGEDYGSWMSNPVFYAFGGGIALAAALAVLSFTAFHSAVLGAIFIAAIAVLLAMVGWMAWIRRQYAFGKGGMMERVHQTILSNLDFDGRGELLEVGCGSGALAIRAALPTLSLTPVDDEDGLREFDVPVESPEEALSDRIGLAEVMDRLDSGDRQLIRLRFFAGRTQSETARVLGTTQVQISRRERRILKWMREQLLEAQ